MRPLICALYIYLIYFICLICGLLSFSLFFLHKYVTVCYNNLQQHKAIRIVSDNKDSYFSPWFGSSKISQNCTPISGKKGVLIMKNWKRFTTTALILTTIIGASASANAATNTSYYDGAKVSVGRGSNNSWHQVSGVSYPSAKGSLRYVYNGKIQYKYTSGTSYSSYWYASISSNGSASSATTTYKSYTLSV